MWAVILLRLGKHKKLYFSNIHLYTRSSHLGNYMVQTPFIPFLIQRLLMYTVMPYFVH